MHVAVIDAIVRAGSAAGLALMAVAAVILVRKRRNGAPTTPR
jgi:LPXTG-motif cell wall-anchored protein